MALDDSMLLEQWRSEGDAEAFRTLVTRYAGVVYAAGQRVLGTSSDVEDVAQECFEALAMAGSKPGDHVGAWLHRVATNRAISHLRSESRRRTREELHFPLPKAETSVEWKDLYRHVDEAINELPDTLRKQWMLFPQT